MTAFMLSVQALLEGEAAPTAATAASRSVPLPIATDAQMMIRALAEQLVSEANAVLREHGELVSLVDDLGPGALGFTLGYRGRAARVQTAMSGRSALVRLILDGRPEPIARQLTGEDELQALVLSLIGTHSTIH